MTKIRDIAATLAILGRSHMVLLSIVAALCAGAISNTAEASHWRFGHVAWQRTADPADDPRAVQVTVLDLEQAQKKSEYCEFT